MSTKVYNPVDALSTGVFIDYYPVHGEVTRE
jgi:hypothetical protein